MESSTQEGPIRLRTLLAGLATICLMVVGTVLPAAAATTTLSPHSWDPGLTGTVSNNQSIVAVAGQRQTARPWGTAGVNYQAGATTAALAGPTGTLRTTMSGNLGTNCSLVHGCAYGSGTGYKGLVQFWNDPNNYVAFGLINDPGVSPRGVTVMIEGASNGRPIGGYWPAGAITGTSHDFQFSWSNNAITWTIDGHTTLGAYHLGLSHPSISFLGAARDTRDSVNLNFHNIAFTSPTDTPVVHDLSDPYASISADMHQGGTGTGFNSMLNIHDAHSNAIAFGIQSDVGSPESRGAPWFMYNRVQNGVFSHGYLAPAGDHDAKIEIRWWRDGHTVLLADGKVVGVIDVDMQPRLFFQAEGDGRRNGDTVDAWARDIQVDVGDDVAGESGLNGAWNTAGPGFANFGLRSVVTNGLPQNGADIHTHGKVSGLPATGDWHSHPVYAVGMIAQYWHGK